MPTERRKSRSRKSRDTECSPEVASGKPPVVYQPIGALHAVNCPGCGHGSMRVEKSWPVEGVWDGTWQCQYRVCPRCGGTAHTRWLHGEPIVR